MNSSMINDDSALNQSSLSARHPYGGSPSSTNPFDKVKIKEDLMIGKDVQKGQKNRQDKTKEKDGNGQNSIKS